MRDITDGHSDYFLIIIEHVVEQEVGDNEFIYEGRRFEDFFDLYTYLK